VFKADGRTCFTQEKLNEGETQVALATCWQSRKTVFLNWVFPCVNRRHAYTQRGVTQKHANVILGETLLQAVTNLEGMLSGSTKAKRMFENTFQT